MEVGGGHHASVALFLGMNPWNPLYKRLVGPQKLSERLKKEYNYLPQ
jgi:hypothetical protein